MNVIEDSYRAREPRFPLSAFDLLGPEKEPQFDRITRLVARLLSVPVAWITLVDDERLFFKSEVGLDGDLAEKREAPLASSFCRLVVASGETLLVEDARRDPRFSDRAATRRPVLVAYLGVPIRMPDGSVVGALSALDREPHAWRPDDAAALRDLAALLETEIAMRFEMSERTRQQEALGLMARELEHRVKNSFSMVQAIVSLSLSTPATSALRDNILDRVASVAQTQGLLAAHHWRYVTFEDIVRSEIGPFDTRGRLDARGPTVLVEAREAVFVAMIVHELTTNAVKYGALAPVAEGRLKLRWRVEDEGSGLRFYLDWREETHGSGSPAKPATGGGFGTELLDLLVVRQLSGTIERRHEPDGFHLSLTLKLASPED